MAGLIQAGKSGPFLFRRGKGDVMEKGIIDEKRNIRRLRFIVDLTQAVLMQSDLTLKEAFDLLAGAKNAASMLFPGKEHVFDLVYAPRLRRIISERFVVPGGLS